MVTPTQAQGGGGLAGARAVRAPRGTEISCRGWQQEAALRMLMNNLDPDVAEAPDELIVYGGVGKAARDWDELRRHRRDSAPAQGRRDPARAERQAGRGLRDTRDGAAGADRQRQPGAGIGPTGTSSAVWTLSASPCTGR